MLKIESVMPGSYAAELGLDAGDRLLRINDREINDLVDYHLGIEAEHLVLEVLRQDDEVWEYELEKYVQEDIGLDVEHPQPRQCGNQCLFCFVHQLPKGLRRSLYIKDEDYRFSFLYGSYITLTNLSAEDLQRILADRLSPLYVSVHATDQRLREKLLGTSVPAILPLLEQLTGAGIVLHCQVVLCPGLNDGYALQQTIEDLARFHPQIASLAVVPVGLTRYRGNLPALESLSQADAVACLQTITRFQQRFLNSLGSRFVFAADEIYQLAGQEIPPLSEYEDCPQIENGVGMTAQFRQQAAEVLLEAEPLQLEQVALVTGRLFAGELEAFADRLSLRTGVHCRLLKVDNRFFGDRVTVSGLVTGRDLLFQARDAGIDCPLLVPDVMLKNEQVFLDDFSLRDLSDALQVPVMVIESSPWGLYEGLELLGDGPEIIHC